MKSTLFIQHRARQGTQIVLVCSFACAYFSACTSTPGPQAQGVTQNAAQNVDVDSIDDRIAVIDAQIADEDYNIAAFQRKIDRVDGMNPENSREINAMAERELASHQAKRQLLLQQKAQLQLQAIKTQTGAFKELQKQMEEQGVVPGSSPLPKTSGLPASLPKVLASSSVTTSPTQAPSITASQVPQVIEEVEPAPRETSELPIPGIAPTPTSLPNR